MSLIRIRGEAAIIPTIKYTVWKLLYLRPLYLHDKGYSLVYQFSFGHSNMRVLKHYLDGIDSKHRWFLSMGGGETYNSNHLSYMPLCHIFLGPSRHIMKQPPWFNLMGCSLIISHSFLGSNWESLGKLTCLLDLTRSASLLYLSLPLTTIKHKMELSFKNGKSLNPKNVWLLPSKWSCIWFCHLRQHWYTTNW